MPRRAQRDPLPSPTPAISGARRWLLFIHQLPSQPSNLRVSTWRRLQQIGAVALKQAVYVLPDTPQAREDFEWLKTDVKASGGDASVFAAGNVDAWSDDDLIEEFRRSRQAAYEALARDAEQALTRTGTRQRRGTRARPFGRQLGIFRERLSAIEAIDFFGSAGRDRVVTLLRQLEQRDPNPRGRKPSSGTALSGETTPYQGRFWITRPRPGVDRMASAWLIRRFIDRQARFGFAGDHETKVEGAVPFDMFGVEFSHQGGGCTFETLCAHFGIDDPAVARIAGIVHDLDLKDGQFGAPEGSTIAAMIEGLQLAYQDDDALLTQGMTLFDSLYRSFERSDRGSGPGVRSKRPRKGPARTRRG